MRVYTVMKMSVDVTVIKITVSIIIKMAVTCVCSQQKCVMR